MNILASATLRALTSTFSSAIFQENTLKTLKFKVECVQTDNGSEFTNRLTSNRDHPTLFEQLLKQPGIQHKLIRPYNPRHNGKAERSHRKDNECFYATQRFQWLTDFKKQLKVHNRWYNNFPTSPLNWLSPLSFLRFFFQTCNIQLINNHYSKQVRLSIMRKLSYFSTCLLLRFWCELPHVFRFWSWQNFRKSRRHEDKGPDRYVHDRADAQNEKNRIDREHSGETQIPIHWTGKLISNRAQKSRISRWPLQFPRNRI